MTSLNWWQAVILGAVQGFTEFLPVSSDGHLSLAQRMLGLHDIPLTFDVIVHSGTLVAMIWFFRKDLWNLRIKEWITLGIATIPVAVIGVVIKPYLETMKYDSLVVAFCFLVSAGFMFLADALFDVEKQKEQSQPWALFLNGIWKWFYTKKSILRVRESSFLQIMLVGLLQPLAILPGLSRSGTTLAAGALAGIPREEAFHIAFLIGIPAITGAVILDVVDVWQAGQWDQHPWGLYGLASLVSLVCGLAALQILQRIMQRSYLQIFAWYCVFASILSVLFV
jgi:undecaprenyl-diphosphatase